MTKTFVCDLCGRRERTPLDRCPHSRADCPLLSQDGVGESPTVIVKEPHAAAKSSASTPVSHSRASLWSGGAGDLVVGQVLGGRFLILGRLGGGGMGEVFEAHDQELGLTVALKFLKGDTAVDSAVAQRFRGEVRLARSISHPNVCRTFDIGEIDSRRYISLEYVAGADLGTVLRWTGGLRKKGIVRLAREICAGLAAVHEAGIVHGDLKPANVLLDRSGRVKLTDFGLARVAAGPAGQLGGTPAYMAPELFDRNMEPDARSDIYALGVMLYELVAGRLPLVGKNLDEFARLHREETPVPPGRHVAEMDSGLQEVILRCLAKDPKDRFQDVASLQLALTAVEQGAPLAALLPERNWVNTEPRSRLIRSLVASAAAVLVATILLVLPSPARSLWSRLPLNISKEAAGERGRALLADLGYRESTKTRWLKLKTEGEIVRRGFAALGREAWPRLQGEAARGIGFSLKTGRPRDENADHAEDDEEAAWPFAPALAKDSSLSAPGDAVLRFDGHGRLVAFEAWPVEEQAPVDFSERLAGAANLKWADYEVSEENPRREIEIEGGRIVRLSYVPRNPSPDFEERIEIDSFQPSAPSDTQAGRLLRFERTLSFGEGKLPADLVEMRKTTPYIAALSTLAVAYGLMLVAAFIVLAMRRAVNWAGSLALGMLLAGLMTAAGAVTDAIINPLDFGFRLLLGFAALLFSAVFVGFFFFGILAATEGALSLWWPFALEGWNRLRSHGVRDVQVMAESVFGMGYSAAGVLCVALWGAVRNAVGWPPVITDGHHLAEVSVASAVPSRMVVLFCVGVLLIFAMAGGAAVLRRVTRRSWFGAVLLWILIVAFSSILSSSWIDLVEHGIAAAFLVLALYRLGVIGAASALFFYLLVRGVPIGIDSAAPFPASSAVALVLTWLLFLPALIRVGVVVASRRSAE